MGVVEGWVSWGLMGVVEDWVYDSWVIGWSCGIFLELVWLCCWVGLRKWVGGVGRLGGWCWEVGWVVLGGWVGGVGRLGGWCWEVGWVVLGGWVEAL